MIERADRAINGRFDLLGLTDISFGNPIDWRLSLYQANARRSIIGARLIT